MGFSKLAIAAGCVLLFAAAFAAGFVFLKSKSGAAAGLEAPAPVSSDNPVEGNKSEDSEKKAADDSSRSSKTVADGAPGDRKSGKAARSTAKDAPRKPFTCADATKQGADCVGRKVTWVGKWKSSQGATVEKQKGSEHFFYTQTPDGGFSFDYPFIAEDPKPLDSPKQAGGIREYFDRKWGPSRIVTVTGTISQLKTLIYIGEGTHYNVPVLTDIKITINP